jgi:hypothetical protein
MYSFQFGTSFTCAYTVFTLRVTRRRVVAVAPVQCRTSLALIQSTHQTVPFYRTGSRLLHGMAALWSPLVSCSHTIALRARKPGFRPRLRIVEDTPARLDRDIGSLPAVPLPRTASQPLLGFAALWSPLVSCSHPIALRAQKPGFRPRLCVVEGTPVRLDRDVGSLPAAPLPRTASQLLRGVCRSLVAIVIVELYADGRANYSSK